MISQMVLMQISNLLSDVMTESVEVFVFGIGLIFFAIALRWFFGRRDARIGVELDKTVS